MRYNVLVSDSGPLSFRKGRDTTSTDTFHYIPGSALRGGLAAVHDKLGRHRAEFRRFFLDSSVRFGNLYPAAAKQSQLEADDNPALPLPATARSCKRFPGFRSDVLEADDPPPHGVYDALTAWTCFAESDQTNAATLRDLRTCPICGESMDTFRGYFRRDAFDSQQMSQTSVQEGLRTRTGILRETDTVAPGVLYSREVLRAGSEFWGTIVVPDDVAQEFRSFVQEANESRMLRVGNNRTRGFGRLVLNLTVGEESASQDDMVEELRARIQAFGQALSQRSELSGVTLSHEQYVPLTLTSDLILRDNALRYQSAITPSDLSQRWGLPASDLIYQNSSTRRVMGWNGLWRMPKPDAAAISQGSVFLFGFEKELPDDALDKFLSLQRAGIGHRRTEGFGQVRVADPFHWEVNGI